MRLANDSVRLNINQRNISLYLPPEGNLQDICFLVMAQFILDETFVLLTQLLDYNIVIIIITRD